VLIEAGEPGEVVLRAAHSLKADLIVTGMARDEFLGRLLLGSTVDTLVRLPVPSGCSLERADAIARAVKAAASYKPSRFSFESNLRA
jgi:hypothetical protein